jgi:hypothetical protein
MLRMIRSTLLYDSIVLRLDNKLDRYHEYTEFMKIRAQFVKRKWRKKLRNNSGDDVFLNVEELGNTLNDVMIRVQTILSRPIVNLGSTVNKWVFAASVWSRMGGRILFFTIVFMSLFGGFEIFSGNPFSFLGTLNDVIHNRLYQIILAVSVVFSVRLILFRLRDRDLNDTNRRNN